MKKLMMSVIAALFAVALVIPANAADKLELSGEYRLRGWDIRNEGFVDGADSSWFDQRMRIGAKINVSDDAHVMIRADLGDGVWGRDFATSGIARPIPGTSSSIDFDRLYMYLDRGMWNLTIGEQYIGLGIAEVLDSNPTAIKLGLDFGAVKPSLIYGKVDEGGSTNDDNLNDDTNLYAGNLSFMLGENFDSNVFYAMVDNNATDDQKWAAGFHTQGKLAALALTGEISYFGGDDGAGTDYTGTQFYLKAESAINEMFSIGGELLYALGTDDPTETQETNLIDWWTFNPMSNNTPGSADFSATGSDPFDPYDQDAGVQALTVFGQFNTSDALSMGLKLGYFQPEETSVTNLDHLLAANAWIAYKLTGNTTASLTYLRVMPEFDTTPPNVEDEGTIYAKFQINF